MKFYRIFHFLLLMLVLAGTANLMADEPEEKEKQVYTMPNPKEGMKVKEAIAFYIDEVKKAINYLQNPDGFTPNLKSESDLLLSKLKELQKELEDFSNSPEYKKNADNPANIDGKYLKKYITIQSQFNTIFGVVPEMSSETQTPVQNRENKTGTEQEAESTGGDNFLLYLIISTVISLGLSGFAIFLGISNKKEREEIIRKFEELKTSYNTYIRESNGKYALKTETEEIKKEIHSIAANVAELKSKTGRGFTVPEQNTSTVNSDARSVPSAPPPPPTIKELEGKLVREYSQTGRDRGAKREFEEKMHRVSINNYESYMTNPAENKPKFSLDENGFFLIPRDPEFNVIFTGFDVPTGKIEILKAVYDITQKNPADRIQNVILPAYVKRNGSEGWELHTPGVMELSY